jgi:hypothetical protein
VLTTSVREISSGSIPTRADIGKPEVDWPLRHSKLLDRQPSGRAAVVTHLVGGIDHPDVTNAHLTIIGKAFVVAKNTIVWLKYLHDR